MSFLAILFSLAIESYWPQVDSWRPYAWFEQYSAWMRQRLESLSGVAALLILLFVLAFGVALVMAMLHAVMVLFAFLFAIAVLLWCLGPASFTREVQLYLDAAEAGDEEAARVHAAVILKRPVDENSQQLARVMREAVLIQGNERLLGVLLWFVVLGPVGAVLYRTNSLLKDQTSGETSIFAATSRNLHRILNWIPSRLCLLGYALGGSFVDSMGEWNGISDFLHRDSEELLVLTGSGALSQEWGNEQEDLHSQFWVHTVAHAAALVKRMLIIWIIIFALMTIAGWLV